MKINLARLDLVSIQLAVLCAELGSLSAATRRAHCSLSTGSHRLSALEQTFGKQLFTRDYRGLRTTAAGELFVSHAKAILEHVDAMNLQVAFTSVSMHGLIFPECRTNPHNATRTES